MFKKILYYLNPLTMFDKQTDERNVNLRFMHGINRISVYMFLICLIILFFRYVI